MRTHTRRAIILAAAILATAANVHSQVLSGVTIERLGALSTFGTGARPFAMGGAYTAAGNDVFALLANPAGLAEMQRGEITVGLDVLHDEITNTYLDLSAAQTSSNTSFGNVAAGYPVPAYRGSFVLAFGVFRTGSSDLESVKDAYLADIGAAVENQYVGSGGIYQYCFGFGVQVSPQISLGAGVALWDESIDTRETINYADADSSAYWTDNVEMDLDGVSFNLGLLIRFTDEVRGGFSFTSPAWLEYEGSGVTTYEGTYTSGGGWTTDPYGAYIHDDYTLPMRFSGGLSFEKKGVTLAADVSYCDFSETEYNDLTITSEVDPGMKHVLQSTWDFRAGAEYALPQAPVRFRAGYAYIPLELTMVEEIAYIADDWATSVVADAEVTRERQYFTFGVGGTIDRVLTLDLGVAIGGWERVTKDGPTTVLTQKRSSTDVVVSGTYRF